MATSVLEVVRLFKPSLKIVSILVGQNPGGHRKV